MKKSIEKAIDEVTKNITLHLDSQDALRYSQAVLNLAHAAMTLRQLELTK